MRISRREFLKYCSIAAGALGLTTTDLLKIEESFAKIGNGGPHVVWIPGQACTGCTVTLANSVFYSTVQDLLLFDIDLDYSETLMAASGDKAVAAAVSAIGKTTILALEGAIPAAATGGDEKFCTVWTRTGGIVAAGSNISAYSTTGATPDGLLVSGFTAFSTTSSTLALAAGDVIAAGSELVFGTSLPVGTIVPNAADRAAMGALGATFSSGSSGYGTDRTNANITIGTFSGAFATNGDVEITGGTDGGGTQTQQGSVLFGATAGGTVLAANTAVASSFDRLWLSNELNNYGDTSSSIVNVTGTVGFTYNSTTNEWLTTNPLTLQKSRAVSGPMIINTASTIGIGSILKAGTRVASPGDQSDLKTDSGIATLFDGYGSSSGTVFAIATQPDFTPLSAAKEIVLSGNVTLAPLTTGALGSTKAEDKTMLHEAEVFGSSAAAILCVGTCSSFGGIPAAIGNRTGASGALYKGLTKAGKYNGVLQQFAGKIINIAGCPPHPDWIVGTIAYILARNLQALPPVEAYGRPIDYYGMYQCNAGPCEWRYNQGYNANDEVSYANPKRIAGTGLGVPAGANATINSSSLYKNKWANIASTGSDNGKRAVGCIGVVGCKGRKTKADCSLRRWNADKPLGPNQGYGTGWCVSSGAGCHGCTEPTFPDKVGKFFNFA